LAPLTKTKTVFPKRALEKVLGSWWDKRTASPLLRRKTADECRKTGGTVFDIQPELSSNQAIPVLLDLETVLGFEPNKDVIRRGGYKDRTHFIQDMTARIEAEFNQRNSTAPTRDLKKEVGIDARV
jgi:hypothetical protein